VLLSAASTFPTASLAPHRLTSIPCAEPALSEAIFPLLYDEHARFVFRVLVRLGVAYRDVEDQVQEVFLVVHRRLGEFRRDSTVRTWIYGIALHVARNYRRTKERRHENASDDVSRAESVPDAAERAPDALVGKARAAELLLRVLEDLDPGSREVFVLAELEEMTALEMGVILGLSPNTVSSRLRKARRLFEDAVRRNRVRDEWRIR
jgi:RNA polymerase sigma-70 factor, ECF subfamily